MTFFYFLSIGFFLFCSAILCLIVLLQEGKAGGVGAMLGGESSDSLFGTSTPEVLKKVTAYLAALFLALCVLLSFWTGSLARQGKSTVPPVEIQETQ